ncbi:response regulator [bacterium]|nr:response regulator [bacterium]
MKVIIAEDEKLAADRLIKMLHNVNPAIEVIAVFDAVKQLKCWLEQHAEQVELAFFDIQLADGTSFEAFENTQFNFPVVFTTAFNQYAIQAFKVNSIDYLLKPIEPEALQNALQKHKRIKTNEIDYQLLIKSLRPEFKDRFLVSVGQKLLPISAGQIAYFYIKDGVVLLVIHKGNKYPVNYNLDELEEMLDPGKFFRINRQLITAIESVQQVHHYFNGKLKLDLLPKPEGEILVSRLKAADFKKWLGY